MFSIREVFHKKYLGTNNVAQKVHERALEIRGSYLRWDHPELADTYYNLACVSALQGHRDAAISFLRESVRRGFAKPIIFSDSDLKSLHDETEFNVLVAEMKARLDQGSQSSAR